MSVIKKAAICASALGMLIIATSGFGALPTQFAACSMFTGGSQCVSGMQGNTPICTCNPGATGSISSPFSLQSNVETSGGEILTIESMNKTFSMLCTGGSWSHDRDFRCADPKSYRHDTSSPCKSYS